MEKHRQREPIDPEKWVSYRLIAQHYPLQVGMRFRLLSGVIVTLVEIESERVRVRREDTQVMYSWPMKDLNCYCLISVPTP